MAVVLAHGLLGLGARSAAKALDASYFHRIEEYLRRRHGLRVLATDVDGIAHSSVRGAQLLQQIREWPERRPAERVSVIAHSQGGLDARWALSRLGGAELVHTLLTLSAPHRGSALCSRLALPLVQNSPAAARAMMESLAVPVEAARFLSPEVMDGFNHECPDSPEVKYYSLGGARRRYTEYWAPFAVLAPLLNRFDPGPNDGLVTASSSEWGEYLGTLNCDHVDQINFPMKVMHRTPMEPLWDYLARAATAEPGVAAPAELLFDPQLWQKDAA